MKQYMVFNIGCIECGVGSNVVGLYDTQEEANKVVAVCVDKLQWREDGQNIFKVYDLTEPQAQEYMEALS